MRFLCSLSLLMVLIFLGGCKSLPYELTNSYIYLQKYGREKSDWKLVWSDDFEAEELDSLKWSRIPPNKADWGRHMTDHSHCYSVKDGLLFLNGIVNPDTVSDSRPFLTGGIYSKGKFAFQYGRVEVRAKLGQAQGAWPAIWMLAEEQKYGAYPRNGEIDIMEHLNFDTLIYQTTHSYYTLVLKQQENPPHYGTAGVAADEFNVYGLEWDADKLVFTLNGYVTFVYPRIEGADASQWPYDQPFYLLIDQQLGGQWVGSVDAQQLPVQMAVDYVRIYQ